MWSSHHRVAAVIAGVMILALREASVAGQQATLESARVNWLTISSNIDTGFHSTQFFEPSHDATVLQWDSRIELWFDSRPERFAWGPYVRVAGIKSSKTPAWENAWLGRPGVGFQAYPFSVRRFRNANSRAGNVFGPVRLFVEYNIVDYWGTENAWRPTRQVRGGVEYWRAMNSNDPARGWWLETWNGFQWQSSNEFSPHYDSLTLANALRAGVRKPGGRFSSLTPYLAAESSRNQNDQSYWENRLVLGGGVRLSPALLRPAGNRFAWLSRFVIYGEVLHAAAYYDQSPSGVPRNDVSAGVSASVGNWFHQ